MCQGWAEQSVSYQLMGEREGKGEERRREGRKIVGRRGENRKRGKKIGGERIEHIFANTM